jgi:hypothetical protein
VFRRSSAVEQLTVNQLVVGSIPTAGAKPGPLCFTISFTNTSYNDGTANYPIRNVARDDSNYTLRFGNGYVIALGAVTPTGLTWVSGQTGTQMNCVRVK